MDPLSMMGAAGISGAGSLIGGLLQNSANKNAADRSNNFSAAQTAAQMDFQQHMYNRSVTDNYDTQMRNFAWQDQAADKAMNFAAGQAANQMGFQRETMNTAMAYNERLANTQMQRRMEDLRAAGLNPMLAYVQGGAAAPQVSGASGASAHGSMGGGSSYSMSAPGGAAARGNMARMENVLGPAVSSALQTMQTVTNVNQAAAQIERTNAETQLLGAQKHQVDAGTARALVGIIGDKELTHLTRQRQGWEPGLRGAETASAAASAERNREEAAVVGPVASAGIGRTRAETEQTQSNTLAQQRYGRSPHMNPLEPIMQTSGTVLDTARDYIREILRRTR